MPESSQKEHEVMSNTISAATPPTRRVPYCAPRNQVEQSLAVIWAETLKLNVDTVGINDSLLDLGGTHSLLVIQLIVRIAGEFGVELPIGEVLSQPTISQQAVLIERIRQQKPA